MNDSKKFSDEELVEKVRAGERDLYAVIIERYQNKLLRYVMYLLRDEHKAVDVVQETFIKAFVNLNSFKVSMKFSSWIYRITHNEAMNAISKYKHEIPMPEDVDFESDENIEDTIRKEEVKEMTNKCLAQMPVLYAEPLALFFIEERSYEEISDILRIPIGTVGTRINRAKALMKKICQSTHK